MPKADTDSRGKPYNWTVQGACNRMELAQGSLAASLPLRLLEHIYSYLTLTELNVAAAVSRHWLGIAAEGAERRKKAEWEAIGQYKMCGTGWLQLLDPDCADARAALVIACDSGNLPVVKWLTARCSPSRGRCYQGIAMAAAYGRQAVMRWMVRVYVSTPQEMCSASDEIPWFCCSRKVRRWLGEQLGQYCTRDSTRPLSQSVSAQLELARWHTDYYGMRWNLEYELARDHPKTSRWLVKQFGAPSACSISIAAFARGSHCSAARLQVLIETYNLTPADVNPIVGLMLARGLLDEYNWLERRYGPPATAVEITRLNYLTARRITERAVLAESEMQRQCVLAGDYLTDTYGLIFGA